MTHLLRRKEQNWIVNQAVWSLKKQYAQLRVDRYNDSDWRNANYWSDAQHCYIDSQKAFHNFGSYYDTEAEVRVNGTKKGFCSTVWDNINNMNDDMLKKLSNEIVAIARKNKVSVVVMEKFNSQLTDSNKSSYENRNSNLWPVGHIKEFLEAKLESLNIALIEVDERNTSQIAEGQWGYREGDDFYYIKKNKLKKVHADENAANNIVDRAMNRHTDLYSLRMTNVVGNYYVPSAIWNDAGEGAVRIRGFLTKLYKKSDVVFIKKDNVLVKADCTIKQLKKSEINNSPERPQLWYRMDGDCWIDEGKRDELIGKVARMVRERDGGDTVSKNLSRDTIDAAIDACESKASSKIKA